MSKYTDDFMKCEVYDGLFTLYDVEGLLYYARKIEKKLEDIQKIVENRERVGPGKYQNVVMDIRLYLYQNK